MSDDLSPLRSPSWRGSSESLAPKPLFVIVAYPRPCPYQRGQSPLFEVAMLRLRALLAFAAMIVVVVASDAQFGQPPGALATTPTRLAATLLPAIDDPNIVAELKLSDEQVKALVARRQEVWDETYTTAPRKFSEGTAARTEATDAVLKKTLTAA